MFFTVRELSSWGTIRQLHKRRGWCGQLLLGVSANLEIFRCLFRTLPTPSTRASTLVCSVLLGKSAYVWIPSTERQRSTRTAPRRLIVRVFLFGKAYTASVQCSVSSVSSKTIRYRAIAFLRVTKCVWSARSHTVFIRRRRRVFSHSSLATDQPLSNLLLQYKVATGTQAQRGVLLEDQGGGREGDVNDDADDYEVQLQAWTWQKNRAQSESAHHSSAKVYMQRWHTEKFELYFAQKWSKSLSLGDT